jgi:MYXO-CTERM domain-containing protein
MKTKNVTIVPSRNSIPLFLGMIANRLLILAALALATLSPLSARAQTSPAGSPYETTARTTADRDDHHDYGWIGLLGLLGLGGLMGIRRRDDRIDARTDVRR